MCFDPYSCIESITHDLSEAFAATGWRVGWLIGPKSIIQPTLAASTRIVFCSNSPLQEAAASGLEQARERQFFEIQRAEYAERRAILADAFDALGMKYTLPEGTYFILLVRRCPNHAFPSLTQCRISLKSIFPKTTPSHPAFWEEGEISGQACCSTIGCISLTDHRACWFIAKEIGVSTIPVSEVMLSIFHCCLY